MMLKFYNAFVPLTAKVQNVPNKGIFVPPRTLNECWSLCSFCFERGPVVLHER